MRTLYALADIRAAITNAHTGGRSIGWVGTSGALHEGHLALVRRARVENDVVLMFWNGAMTFPWAAESSPSYPRQLDRDAAMAADVGVDVLWIPDGAEVFPTPPMTQLTVPRFHRPGLMSAQHLDVVALFMTKYLSIIGGCSCYMGEKDWEQQSMMRAIVDDLWLPVHRFVTVPTIRAEDGVPMSSRNHKLTPQQREQAAVVPRALQAGARAIEAGERDPAAVRATIAAAVAEVAPLEYAYVLDESMAELEHLAGDVRLMAGARFGDTVILDNIGVSVDP